MLKEKHQYFMIHVLSKYLCFANDCLAQSILKVKTTISTLYSVKYKAFY